MSTLLTRLLVVAALVVSALAMPAQADPVTVGTLSNTVVRIDATSGGQTASYTLTLDPTLLVDGYYNTSLPNAISLTSGGHVLGRIDYLQLFYGTDPFVKLNFHVTADASDTVFSVSSATVTFSNLVNPTAYFSAAVTVTDNDSNGAAMTGLFSGVKAYEARTNLGVFADLIGITTAGVDDSASATDRNPLAGYQTISGTVNSIESQYNFTLSANDSASGTSRFDVVPEPATLGLVGIGLVGLLLRSRRTPTA